MLAILYMFYLLGVFRPTENFSLIWRRHHYMWKTANFDLHLCSALIVIEQWGSLANQTYCDMGHSFIIVISDNPWHSLLLPSVWQWSCHYLFNDVGLSRLGFEHPTSRFRFRSYPRCHLRGAILYVTMLLTNVSPAWWSSLISK